MKTFTLPFAKKLTTAALAASCLFALPEISLAKDKDKDRDKHRKSKYDKHDDHDHDHDRGRSYYSSRPRSSFSLSFGSGYAGHGYYYGPSNSSYYYRQPGVSYYRTRESYYGSPIYRGNSMDYEVQKALARRGYYRGPIDGDIGPGSRSAIARYQRDRGLHVTGSISSSLLRSLGIG